MRRSLALVTLACTLATVGCGSTVQVSSSMSGSGGVPDGLQGSAAPPVVAGAGGFAGSSAGGATGPAASEGTTARTVSGGATPGGSTVVRSEAPGARGSTQPIKVAYTIWDQTGFTALTGNTQTGQNSGANQSADEREMAALVAYANATGGVAGRKIAKPVGIRVSTTDATNEQTMNAYCTRATEDVKADVYIDRSFFLTDNELACFAKHHTTFVGLLATTSDSLYAQLAPYIASTAPSLERTASVLVTGLSDAGYFKGAKVGVVLDDTPAVDLAYRRLMLPGMKRLGVTPTSVVRLSTDSSNQASQASSAVLKFRTEGVDHVVYFSGFFGMLAFTNTADSQGYYPRYGWSDYFADASNAAFYASPRQNANAVAVTSANGSVRDPGQDQPASLSTDYSRDDKRLSAGQRRCLDILSKYTGVDYYKGSSGRSTEYMLYCEHFLLWLDSARRTTGLFSPATWGTGLASLGRSYQPVLMNSTDFTHRFGGADTYRVGVYSTNTACKCFTAITPWRRF